MIPGDYTRERLVQAHRRDLLREADHEQLLAQLPQARYKRVLFSLLWRPLRTLRMRWSKRFRRRLP